MLNKTRSYGEVSGIANCKYEQDGKQFNAEGHEVDSKGQLTAKAKAEIKAAEEASAKEEAKAKAEIK